MSHASVPVTDDQFRDTVLRSELPVLVDFWAPWCSPCRAVAPALEELARDYADRLVVAKVNTDKSQHKAAEYAIQGIPTMILFRGGEEVDRLVGTLPKSSLARWVDNHILP